MDEPGHGGDDRLLLRQRELAVDGKREAFCGSALGRRKVAGAVPQMTKARLFTLLIAAVMLAALLAGAKHGTGMSDGGYW